MTANKRNKTKSLQVILPEAEKRRIKILAAREGLTLGQAISQAFTAWEAQLQPHGRAGVATSTGDTAEAGQGERAAPHRPRAATRSRQRLQADAGTAATRAVAGQAPQRTPAGAWIGRAAKLDWSKCPLVETAPGKDDNIWVLRGTDVPLASVLIAVDEGHPLLEISHAYEISMQFLLAVLQYVATPAKPAATGG